MKTKFSSCISLILECCKITQDITKIKELIPSINNWDDFIDISYAHGVFPLVYHTLKLHVDTMPEKVLSTMKSHNIDIVKQNMLMTAELIKVMKLLEDNGIEAMPFKGPLLAQSIYGSIADRLYSDLDILINQNDIEKCYLLLSQNNYTTEYKKEYLKNSLYLDKNSDIQYFHNTKNILIEMHWKLFRNQFSKSISHTNLLNNKSEVIIQNQKLYTFNDEILLVYLCMHGSKHCWERISWILDIDKLVRSNQNLNWKFIKEQAIELECETMLYLGLELSSKLFNTPVTIKYNTNIELVTIVEKSFEHLHVEQRETSKNSTSFKFHYALHDTIFQKVRFITRTIFPINGQDILTVNLPNSLYFLYYIIKPFRLIVKYISKLFK